MEKSNCTVTDERAQLLAQIASDRKRIGVLMQAVTDPKRAIESLDILIRDPKTSAESRARYSDLRTALEAFALEMEST